jgi:methionyl-tRNA formyltransferase
MVKLALAGTKNTTHECITQLLRDGFKPDLLITLTPKMGEENDVSGYVDLHHFAQKQDIPVYYPKSYTLKTEDDKAYLLEQGIDLLLVIGWQRLIPEWWLNALSIGAFGMHGSPEPLPRGRGRSPMNWSLLNGKSSFLTNLFKYDAGIDSGMIVGTQKFDINLWDDCNTLHMKNRIAMNRLLKLHLPKLLASESLLLPQSNDIEATYFPKRTAEDGRILWDNLDMIALYNNIRAQTHPFTGAFSHLNGEERPFYFWKGHPFDGHLIYSESRPGAVVEVFYDDSFLVAVWDGAVRVYEYSSPDGKPPRIGQQFMNFPLPI